jgi:hypothetical protein
MQWTPPSSSGIIPMSGVVGGMARSVTMARIEKKGDTMRLMTACRDWHRCARHDVAFEMFGGRSRVGAWIVVLWAEVVAHQARAMCAARGHVYEPTFVSPEDGREEHECARCGHGIVTQW